MAAAYTVFARGRHDILVDMACRRSLEAASSNPKEEIINRCQPASCGPKGALRGEL